MARQRQCRITPTKTEEDAIGATQIWLDVLTPVKRGIQACTKAPPLCLIYCVWWRSLTFLALDLIPQARHLLSVSAATVVISSLGERQLWKPEHAPSMQASSTQAAQRGVTLQRYLYDKAARYMW